MGRRYLPLDLRSILVILVAVVQYVYSMDLFYSGQFEACTNVTLEWLGGAAPYNIVCHIFKFWLILSDLHFSRSWSGTL
ncbi:hypothetical protein C8Q75DRAFT_511105 [Abortiporus biennis]|nr:hypothetical protein C8Q75DRAFT_511105 [Abortiporus biennis]